MHALLSPNPRAWLARALIAMLALALGLGAAAKEIAMNPPLKGTVLVEERAGVRIHTYVSPADGWLVNTQIVEGPTWLVMFDGQLLNAYAQEVATYVDRLGKPMERIIVSHSHPDHWAGLEVLARRFPDAPVYALDGVADTIRQRGPRMLAGLQRAMGTQVATQTTVPTRVLPVGTVEIDGIVFEFQAHRDAESDLQLLALMPAQRVMLAFDLVFGPQDHLFTTAPHFEHWAGILQALKAIRGYDLILTGHGRPATPAAIDATLAYLARAAAVHAESADGATYAQRLKAAFPERGNAGWVDFSARLLYAPPAQP